MATFETIDPTQVDAKSPINQLLMYGNTGTDTGGVKFNFDALNDRLTAVEGSSGGAGGGANNGAFGEVLAGGETNVGVLWKRRFSTLQHMRVADSENPVSFDPEGTLLKNDLLTFLQENETGISYVTTNNSYLGAEIVVSDETKVFFKIKEGVNYFSLGFFIGASGSSNIEILIDGQTPSSLGLKNEEGGSASDSFSALAPSGKYQKTEFFYGLDGNEHLVEVYNNDGGGISFNWTFVEIGFLSPEYSIDESFKINSGKASVRGSEVSFNEFEGSFGSIDRNGHTGSVVLDTDGLVTLLDGESPAMTQVKAEESISFSSSVTTLPVKNNFYFPESGICLMSTPYGSNFLFSYESKTDTLIQSHSFDDIIWSSQPTLDFSPLSGFNGGTGAALGDLNINYWATAPILIDSTNEKIDFKITIGGVTTTHAATIANGRYSADLIPLGRAVKTAMQAAKPLLGEYNLSYDQVTQLWSISANDSEIEDFQLLFSTGVNSANSIHTTIGFAANDLTGDTSYTGSVEFQHKACRVLEADNVFMHSEDPRIKYSEPTNGASALDNQRNVENILGLGSVRYLNDGFIAQIFTDEDASGLAVSFITTQNGSMITYQIDDGQCLYLTQTDDNTHPSTVVRSKVITSMISFPRGSKKITIRQETSVEFSVDVNDERTYFVGCRQFFTKPSYEKLSRSQSIIKAVDVSPLSLYATNYSNNSGVYSPNASNDNINTITESGTWSSVGASSYFNQSLRRTNTSGGYTEIDFTLVGDGGGISLLGAMTAGNTRGVLTYLSSSAINEATDHIGNTFTEWSPPTAAYWDNNHTQLLGLPAGTYKFRAKSLTSGNFDYSAITVYDTVSPEENKNTLSDISNTGQSVSFPINVRRTCALADSGERVPIWLLRSGYKEGITSNGFNYSIATNLTGNNTDDGLDIITSSDRYYGAHYNLETAGDEMIFSGLAKSVSIGTASSVTLTDDVQPFIDGIQTLNNYSLRECVKGGTAPSATRISYCVQCTKEFKLTASHDSGETFLVNDTRGFKNDMKIVLNDGTNKEVAHIDSFVVGTSFTVKKAPSLVVAANVTDLDFSGFHSIKLVANDGVTLFFDGFRYEPLTLSPSKSFQRRNTSFKYEKVGVTFRNISDGDDAYYPVHSDGVQGDWSTSSIQVTRTGALDTYYNILQDLKNIGVTNNTIDIKVNSERLVPVLDEKERF